MARHSHEGGPRADTRHRLVVTHRVPSLAPHPTLPKTLLWNPQGASLEEAWAQTRRARRHAGGDRRAATSTRSSSTAAIDAFHLSRVAGVRLPGGVPVFPGIGPDRTPEDILAEHGLKPGPQRVLDAAAGATLVTWQR